MEKSKTAKLTNLERLLSYVWYQSLENEEWREVPFTDGNYFVSSFGRVLSLCRYKAKILKPFNIHGYLCVDIRQNKIRITARIHRLVALAFLENPEEKPVVHHKNGIKTDNNLLNLAWATEKENRIAYLESQKEQLKNGSQLASG